uniref:Uncharacterized protein AlNc14C104G6157 n=1 Tax=Albugo laibachii Nc14 TaxID=890382 RepID=F0WHV0_9STRA|nr:conserved hypothetical protein [Albugo laibachii Nc14]|eukprot:CCA20825.1 conserved hypothetical protein [Albugo laibachii Nc14]
MFNRFFKKEEGGNKQPAGPPAFRPSYNVNANSTGAATGGAPHDANAAAERNGGGFFNLPPSANAKPLPTSHNTSNISHGMHSSPASSTVSDHKNCSMNMFGGMSVKQPPSTTSMYTEEKPMNAPSSDSNNLFSGLDMVSKTPPIIPTNTPIATNEIPQRRRNTANARPNTFNYLDTVQSNEIHSTTSGTNGANVATSGPLAVSRTLKVKKKKKTFRPGFGRQLSEEAVAALQRGDLPEAEIVKASANTPKPVAKTSMYDVSDDLTSLLPPLPGKLSNSGELSSVLAGLTVHNPTIRKESSTSILAGLTVHTNQSPASISAANEPSPTSSIHSTSSILYTNSMPKVTESKQVISPDVKLKLKYTHYESSTKSPLQPSLSPIVSQSLEERVTATLNDFNESAFAFHKTISRQNEEESRLLERKMQLAAQLAQYEIDLRQVEANQQRACEEEDFEKADALNTSLNSVRHCITLTESDLRKAETEFAAFLKVKERTFVTQLRTTRGTFKELNTFCQDEENIRADLRKQYDTYQTNQLQQLQFENERIQTELHHVSVTLKHVTSERDEIEARITEQCKSEMQVQKTLEEEKQVVEQEVRELELQLSMKKARVTEIQTAIDKAEKEIDVVRNRFSRQVKRISDREEGILRTKFEVEADVEHLKEQKEQFIEKVCEYQQRIMESSTQIKSLRKAIMVATLLTNVLEMQEARREESLVRKKKRSSDLSTLSDKAAITEQSVAMLRKQQEELAKSLEMHANAKASADSMIPRLESEKKAAATQRNFKEAARISKDIKALEKDRSTAEEMSEVVEMELQDLEDQIKSSCETYDQHKEEMITAEKTMDLETLEELCQEYKDLGKAKREMERCRIEKDGIKSGNDQSKQSLSFLSAALVLIKTELDACMVQIQNLEKKHDIHRSLDDEMEELSDIEECNEAKFSDDEMLEFASQLKTLKEKISSLSQIENLEPTVNGEPESTSDCATTLEDIDARLTSLELDIEKATESEDYEVAAQLDEQFDILSRQKQKLLDLQQENVIQMEEASEIKSEEGSEPNSGTDRNVTREKEQSTPSIDKEDDIAGHDEPDEMTVEALEKAIGELEVSLAYLFNQEQALERDIVRASDEENFEAAAEYDEELDNVRTDIESTKHELDEFERRLSNKKGVIGAQENEMATNANNLFAGLGLKIATHPVEDKQHSDDAGSASDEEDRNASSSDSADSEEDSLAVQLSPVEVESEDIVATKLDAAPITKLDESQSGESKDAHELEQESEMSNNLFAGLGLKTTTHPVENVLHTDDAGSVSDEEDRDASSSDSTDSEEDSLAVQLSSVEVESEDIVATNLDAAPIKKLEDSQSSVSKDAHELDQECEVSQHESEEVVMDSEERQHESEVVVMESEESQHECKEVVEESESNAMAPASQVSHNSDNHSETEKTLPAEKNSLIPDDQVALCESGYNVEHESETCDAEGGRVEDNAEAIGEENLSVRAETSEEILEKSQFEVTKSSLFDGLSFVTSKISQLTSIPEQIKTSTEDPPPDPNTHQDTVQVDNAENVEFASL